MAFTLLLIFVDFCSGAHSRILTTTLTSDYLGIWPDSLNYLHKVLVGNLLKSVALHSEYVPWRLFHGMLKFKRMWEIKWKRKEQGYLLKNKEHIKRERYNYI